MSERAALDPAEVEALERNVETERARVAELEKRLAQTRDRTAKAIELVGAGVDGVPLAAGPLVAALVACLSALVGVWFAYVSVVFLDAWTYAVGISAMFIAAPLHVFAHRPGAGGSARALLRKATWACLAVAALGLLAGVLRIASGAHTTGF